MCKHYSKWNAYRYPAKYRVVLKCSQNETLYEKNLFSYWFEISNWYKFILFFMWMYCQSQLCFTWKEHFLFYYFWHMLHLSISNLKPTDEFRCSLGIYIFPLFWSNEDSKGILPWKWQKLPPRVILKGLEVSK